MAGQAASCSIMYVSGLLRRTCVLQFRCPKGPKRTILSSMLLSTFDGSFFLWSTAEAAFVVGHTSDTQAYEHLENPEEEVLATTALDGCEWVYSPRVCCHVLLIQGFVEESSITGIVRCASGTVWQVCLSSAAG